MEGADVQLFCRAEGDSPVIWLDQRGNKILSDGKYTVCSISTNKAKTLLHCYGYGIITEFLWRHSIVSTHCLANHNIIVS